MASKVMDGPQQMDGTYLRRLDRMCIKIKILHKLFLDAWKKGDVRKKMGLDLFMRRCLTNLQSVAFDLNRLEFLST